MSEVFPGRFTARAPEDATAVFLIGMRINTFAGIAKARPVLTAMPKMLRHLSENPDAGLLAMHQWLGRTTILLTYWRSVDDVQRFASDPDAPHAPAWRAFNKKFANSRHVGVWHELYSVHRGDFEGTYVNMPRFGMALAGQHLPITDGLRTSKQRMQSV